MRVHGEGCFYMIGRRRVSFRGRKPRGQGRQEIKVDVDGVKKLEGWEDCQSLQKEFQRFMEGSQKATRKVFSRVLALKVQVSAYGDARTIFVTLCTRLSWLLSKNIKVLACDAPEINVLGGGVYA